MKKLESSRRCRRKLKYLNENNVPHNLKYGRWYFGKLRSFKGNINSLPVAGVPMTPSTNAVKAKAALQYAFLTSQECARRYALENRSTLMDVYEGCSANFDFKQGTVMLKVIYGAKTKEMRLTLPRELHDSTDIMELRWTYKGTKFYDEGLPAS